MNLQFSGSIGMFLREQESIHGSTRKAAAHFGIDPAYWWRLKEGQKSSPSQEILDKLGLEPVITIYQKKPP